MMLINKKAFIYLHDNVLLIGTCSGPGACVLDDWECPVLKVNFSEITDAEIGREVRAAWSRCREIPLVGYVECDISAHKQLMGVKTNKKLYAKTKSISPLLKNGIITVQASWQNRIGGFEGMDEQIELPETASDEELGIAVREMLNQSKTNY
jgi:hypothetical protein